jgi:hypothetical protein
LWEEVVPLKISLPVQNDSELHNTDTFKSRRIQKHLAANARKNRHDKQFKIIAEMMLWFKTGDFRVNSGVKIPI